MVKKTSFVQKLHWLLTEEEKFSKYICWGAAGTSFLILDVPSFSSEVLPKVFKHANYTSFVRQLNLYGFHKLNRSYHRSAPSDGPNNNHIIEKDQEPREFFHPDFTRQLNDLSIIEIKRKASNYEKKQLALSASTGGGGMGTASSRNPRPTNKEYYHDNHTSSLPLLLSSSSLSSAAAATSSTHHNIVHMAKRVKLGDSSNVFRMDSLLVPYKATTAVSVNSSKETDSVIAVVNKRDESSGGARNRDSDDGERAHGDEDDDLSSASSLLSQNMESSILSIITDDTTRRKFSIQSINSNNSSSNSNNEHLTKITALKRKVDELEAWKRQAIQRLEWFEKNFVKRHEQNSAGATLLPPAKFYTFPSMAGVLAVGPDSKSDAAAAGAAAEFVPLPAAARSAEADHWSSSTEPTSILTPP